MEKEANLRTDGCDPFKFEEMKARLGSIAHPAFEITLCDLLGTDLNVPVYALLGGKRRDRITFCYPNFAMQTPEGEDAGPEIRH